MRDKKAGELILDRSFSVPPISCIHPASMMMKPALEIDFLFWKECPSHPKAWERLQETLRGLHIKANVRRIEVKTGDEARNLSFPGSPTIRVNGKDIDPKGAENQPSRLTCRIYYDLEGKVTPIPPRDLVLKSLQKYQ